MVTLRPARPADARAAAGCHLACWSEAYEGIADPEALRSRTEDVDGRAVRWEALITSGPPRVLAVADDGEVLGFAAAGPGRDDDLEVTLELYALYVRRSEYGTGLGARLLAAAIGTEPAYLWVFEDNGRACAFYGRHGFTPDGARKHDEAFGAWEVRLRC